MWPRGIVIGDPVADELAGLVEIGEQALIKELIAHPAVEGLAVAVLHRPAWRDVVPLHAVILRPAQDSIRGELGAVVRHDHPRLAAADDERRQLACDPFT